MGTGRLAAIPPHPPAGEPRPSDLAKTGVLSAPFRSCGRVPFGWEANVCGAALNRSRLQSFRRPMAKESISSNDNELATRAELEASNCQLRASLKRCEDLVSDCKDKLMQAYGLDQPAEAKGPGTRS